MPSWRAFVFGFGASFLAEAVALNEVYRLMQQSPLQEIQQHREMPPAQPIHRSILSHRKRRVLQSPGADAEEDNKDHHNSQSHEEASQQPSPPNEPTPPLLTSEWWVRIGEEVGENVWNYVPESRRAASSVIYTYRHSEGRVLEENEDASGAEGPGDDDTVAENENTTAEEAQASSQDVHSPEPPKQEAEAQEADTEGNEWIVINGGYTDHDWKTFPVYAFPITSAIRTESGQWIDLSPSIDLGQADVDSNCLEEDGEAARDKLYTQAQFLDVDDAGNVEDPWKKAQNCAPTGRMGHSSVVHNDKLYVFGGLIFDEEQATSRYRKETFRLEDVPFVYRLDLKEMFEARRAESEGRTPSKVTGWQRIVPRVKPFPTPAGMSSTSAAEVLLTSINRGEMQGGLWSDSAGGSDKFVMYGGLRIARVEYEGYGHNDPTKFVKGETAFGSSSQMHSHKIVELPLGDVWAYELDLDRWEKVTNNYGRPIKDGEDPEPSDGVDEEANDAKNPPISNDEWFDVDISAFPRPRTAHAATVVGNSLIIHGGMGWNERTNDWDGSTDWETLKDMWILDLNTREWKRRYLFPPLVRSYHTLVGWNMEDNLAGWGKDLGFGNYTSWEGPIVAAFGGYCTGIDVFSGEELAYVFDDLLISYPPPPKSTIDEPLSPWLKASMNQDRDGAEMISTRYEHSSVLSREGVLVVWGGSFSNTKNIKGMWMINIAGEDSALHLSLAQEDEIFDDYERTITALHTIVIMLMFMSISLTLLLGLTQRYQELVQQANDEAAVAAGMAFAGQDDGNAQPARRGNGLHPEIINTIPRKIYSASENEGDGADGDQDCCPICLSSYQAGDELRVLPCTHAMHIACLDSWLINHPSCPSCRHSLSELVDDRPLMQLRTIRSRLSHNSPLARFLRHHSEEGIELGEIRIPRETVIDFRYVSSLELSEEGDESGSNEEGEVHGDTTGDAPTHIAMSELARWRRRRHQLRDSRVSRLSRLRSNVPRIGGQRPSRVPLADIDGE